MQPATAPQTKPKTSTTQHQQGQVCVQSKVRSDHLLMKLDLALESCGRSRCWCLPARGPAPAPAFLSWAKPRGAVGWHWRDTGTLSESWGLEVNQSQKSRTSTCLAFPSLVTLLWCLCLAAGCAVHEYIQEKGQKPPVLWQAGSVVPNTRISSIADLSTSASIF